MTGTTRIALVAAVAALLVGCQPRPGPQVIVANRSGHTFTLYVQRTGQPRYRLSLLGVRENFQYTNSVIRGGRCEEAKIVAVRDDGRTFETGPPLCGGQMLVLKK